ncbi:MAG: chromosome segregation protein SMC, partial [Oscillospiraceae bacterium]|nr:chromosome segregation protein SMC [Oscillospiraceae bacterium]
SSLVTCDADYRGIVSYLLGRTIVVRTMADAIRISCRRENRLRIVTLDGQMINAGGSMTGGSLAKNTGILSRANELKRLKKRRGELETSLSDVLHEIEECKHRAEQGAIAWETAVNGLEAAEETLRTKENDVQRSEMLLDSVQHTADGFASDLEEVKQQIDDCRARIKQTNEQASEIQLKLDETRALISGMTAGQNEYERIRQSLSDELAEIKAQEAALRTEYSAVERAKEQVREMLGSVDLDKQAKTEEIGSAMDDVEMLRIALADGRNTIAKTAQAVADLKEEISNLIQTRLELERERNLTDKQAQDCNHQLLEMERLCSRFEQKKLTADLEEKQIIDRLWDNYGLVHSEAVKMRQPIENASAASRRIGELHKAISALGTPNFGAIDEYARVSERYEFLAGQRDDVEKSKKEILDIIGDVTAQMKEVFNEQFKLINECFRETFLELFGGGKAALVLEDENDVLECGIEIKVQPPGKALSSINLLSGGEMAFVAIALYFAIIKVRPTPFCVMDEIEAALDEANVIRFAEYLRSMCSNTQFIVITHRRGTMEAENRLYGVTMQEKGISRIIELDVAEAELRIAAEEG